jgi:hypothetical protein
MIISQAAQEVNGLVSVTHELLCVLCIADVPPTTEAVRYMSRPQLMQRRLGNARVTVRPVYCGRITCH